jgi:hypothetical protein
LVCFKIIWFVCVFMCMCVSVCVMWKSVRYPEKYPLRVVTHK